MSSNKNTKKDTKSNIKDKIIEFFKKNTNNILFLLIGLAIGFSCIFFFIPERIAKLANGEEPVVTVDGLVISASDYYETLKDNISVDLLLQDVDKFLLDELYETTSTIKSEVTENMNSIINEYTTYYQYTEKQFFEDNNLRDRDTFFELLLIDYKRNLYYEDYLRDQVTDSDIILYYNNLTPDIEIKYVMAESEETIKEIQSALNNGKSYNDIIKSYKSSITYQNMGYISFDNIEIDDNIYEKAITLKDNDYSKEYITIDNNYTIVFRGESKDKVSVDEIKDRIIEKMKDEQVAEDTDKTLYYKSLIKLRSDHNITFADTVLEKEYKEYANSYK